MATGTLREIVFDCAHPAGLARFWARLLDGFEVRAYDEPEIARLAERGLTPETDTNVMLDGPGLKLCFQKADTRSVPKNKLHVDIVSDNRSDLVKRLCDQGASIVKEFDDSTWMRDPEDNDFCITDPW
jgi:hypothetical protein